VDSGNAIIEYIAGGCHVSIIFRVNPLPSVITGPANLCLGTNGTELDGLSGGVWTSSVLTVGTIDPSTGFFTSLHAGTTAITYTLPTTCFINRPVTVVDTPSDIYTLSTGRVCIGSTIVLDDTTAGGTWSSSVTGVGTVTGSGSAGTVHGVGVVGVGGTTTISYSVAGCPSTFIVTVNPQPGPISGPDSMCVGDCSNIYTVGSPSGGLWSNSTGGSGTIDPVTGVFCAITSGTVTITYTLTGSDCARSKIITVNPLPAPIGVALPATSAEVCVGFTDTLTETTAGGRWSTSSGNVTLSGSTGLRDTLTGGTAGTAIVTYTSHLGCATSITVTVNALPNPITGTDTVCAGLTVTLTSAGSPPGTWSSSNVGAGTVDAGGTVTGLTGGLTDISYTLSTGCYVVYEMTINGSPIFSTFPSPAFMCIASPPISIVASGGAGMWTSSNTGVAAVTNTPPTDGTITAVSSPPAPANTTNICFTFTSTGCMACRQFTVNPLPGPISPAGPSTVCQGSTINLTDPTTPGGTWTSSTGAVTIGTSSGIASGTTTVGSPSVITYTLGTGCTVTTTINVNPVPNAITGTLAICQGLNTTLCNTTGPATGYTWSSSNTAAATLITGGLCTTVTAVATVTPTTSTIKYTNDFTGCFSSVIVTVNSLSTGISGPNAVCMGQTITETEAIDGNWSSSAAGIATLTGGVLPAAPTTSTIVNPVFPGTFTLTFASTTGCSVSKTITVNPIPSAIIVPLESTNLCPGGFTELTASTGAGYTYQWFDPAAIPGATNSTYYATAAGTFSVTATLGPCSITSPGTGVTMNPATASITGTAFTACASAGVTLNAFSPALPTVYTYQWQLGGVPIAGAVTNTFTPTVSGNYTVVESNSFGCSATSTPPTTVTLVASPPGVITVTGSLTFCAGNHVTLTGDAGAGYTYQWYNGVASPIAGATNISYTTGTAGTYSVTETNTTGCTTTSSDFVVAVDPLPVATITAGSALVFCAGGAVALAAPGVAGNTFQWYDNGVAITGANTAVYTASTTGDYKVVVDSPLTGCTATSATDTVVVVTTPSIIPETPTSFCWGSSAPLSVILTPGAGIVTYQWTLDGVNIPGGTNSSYNATDSGTFACKVMVGAGVCTTTSISVNLKENPLPNPLVSYYSNVLHAQTYYTSYQWYYNGTAIPGANAAATDPIGNGTYKVKVIDTNGCQSLSAGDIVSGWVPSGIAPLTANGSDIMIFPNPAQDAVHIQSPIEVRAVISSIDGRTVIDQAAAKDINIGKLANGIYTIRLYDASGQMVKVDKLVKEGN